MDHRIRHQERALSGKKKSTYEYGEVERRLWRERAKCGLNDVEMAHVLAAAKHAVAWLRRVANLTRVSAVRGTLCDARASLMHSVLCCATFRGSDHGHPRDCGHPRIWHACWEGVRDAEQHVKNMPYKSAALWRLAAAIEWVRLLLDLTLPPDPPAPPNKTIILHNPSFEVGYYATEDWI